jgi:hypothetical protein
LVLTGELEDRADFDPGPGLDEHLSQGLFDVFVTMLFEL